MGTVSLVRRLIHRFDAAITGKPACTRCGKAIWDRPKVALCRLCHLTELTK